MTSGLSATPRPNSEELLSPPKRRQVWLEGFQLAVDIKRALLAIRPLKGSSPKVERLQFQPGDLLVALAPSEINAVLGAFHEQRLRIKLSQKSQRCGAFQTQKISFFDLQLPLTEVEPEYQRRRPELRVRVGGDGPGGTQLRLRAEQIARRCLRYMNTSLLRGALIVELRSSPLGLPEPPRMVVDGLIRPLLSRCLLNELRHSELLWRELPPGARDLLPFYFGPRVDSP